MSTLETRIRRDQDRVILHLWGSVDGGTSLSETIIDPTQLTGEATHLKLLDTTRFIQKDLCLLFYWEGEEDHTLILPLEGIGKVDLADMDGMLDPKKEGFTGRVIMRTENKTTEEKHFSVLLEFGKQRG